MAADPFWFSFWFPVCYFLLFKRLSDKWGFLHPMRTEIALDSNLVFAFHFSFVCFVVVWFPPPNFYSGHQEYFFFY